MQKNLTITNRFSKYSHSSDSRIHREFLTTLLLALWRRADTHIMIYTILALPYRYSYLALFIATILNHKISKRLVKIFTGCLKIDRLLKKFTDW